MPATVLLAGRASDGVPRGYFHPPSLARPANALSRASRAAQSNPAGLIPWRVLLPGQ